MSMKPENRITASDLRRHVEGMLAAGTMPNLETVLQAVSEIRAKYVPLIKAARLGTRREN